MYWTDENNGIVMKGTMDLSESEVIVTDIVSVGEIVVDHDASRLYWIEYGAAKIEQLVETSDLD